MKHFTLLIIIMFSLQLFSHEKDQSRADFFKTELRANEQLLELIESIENLSTLVL